MKGGLSSDDIIFALEALGFDVEDEDDNMVVLSDGNYTVQVSHSINQKVEKQIREHLEPIFDDYEDQVSELTGDEDSDDYDGNVKRVADWLRS